MTRHTQPVGPWAQRLEKVVFLGGTLILAGAAYAQSALQPLPRCDVGSREFYLIRYNSPTAAGVPPTVSLDRATIPASGNVILQNIWNGLGAAPVSPREIAPAGQATPYDAGATVAAGMSPDGYIYAMRAVQGDNAWDNAPAAGWNNAQGGGWRTHTRHYELLRYGRDGVENLGVIDGLGIYRTDPTDPGTEVAGAVDYRLGPNFNAADINPVNGYLYIANFQDNGSLSKVHVVDVQSTPPALVNTITLSSNIPGAQSGDFAIDPTGQYAYGVAYTSLLDSQAYRIDLATGAVTSLSPLLFHAPYGGAARLLDGSYVFYNGVLTVTLNTTNGTLNDGRSTPSANSADAASCLPKFTATLSCTPTDLFDAPGNASTCTVTLNEPAPAGGLSIALTPPAVNPRYDTTCSSSITVPAGATTATCTITATPNTVPGDGDVTATLALATPAATDDYVLGTPDEATVTVQNDDFGGGSGGTVAPVPTLGGWSLASLGLGLLGLGLRTSRKR